MKRAALLFVGLFLVASLGFIQVQTGETRMETPKEKEKQILSILKANYGDSAPSKLEYVPSDLLMKTQKGPDTGLVAEAKEKQVAQGKILNEDNGELLLDSKPCMSKIITFQQPYKKTNMGPAKCGDLEYTKYQVEQKKK